MQYLNDKVIVVYKLTLGQQQDLLELYKNEWWTADVAESDLNTILQKSSIVIGFVDTASNKLIGFTRVLTDYFRFAYIYDVIVHTDYRSTGLGKRLISFVLEHPDIKPIKNIELVCKKEMTPFYKQFGFSENYATLIPMRKQKTINQV